MSSKKLSTGAVIELTSLCVCLLLIGFILCWQFGNYQRQLAYRISAFPDWWVWLTSLAVDSVI